MATPNQGLAAEIVTTGTELLLGEIVDTNAAWMAQQLREAGVNLYYKTTVGDNEVRLRGVIELALSRSDAIIVSGGLGPTADDITRQAIAAATGRRLVFDDRAMEALRARFARFGAEMTENNRQQALIPEGAILIENPVGTAPGFIVEVVDRTAMPARQRAVIAVPGVPREMMRLMTDTVIPYLRERNGASGVIRRRVLRTIGIGESKLDSLLGSMMLKSNPTVGLAAHTAQADIRITARATTAEEAELLVDGMAERVNKLVGEHVYSTEPGESIEAVVAEMLNQAGAAVSVFESNTGGAISMRLRSAGEDSVLGPSWNVASPGLPDDLAQIMQGAGTPTEETAVQLARSVRALGQTAFGLAVLGTSGSEDGVFGRAEGMTWIALAHADGERTSHVPYGGTDDHTVARLGNQALNLLWRYLKTAS